MTGRRIRHEQHVLQIAVAVLLMGVSLAAGAERARINAAHCPAEFRKCDPVMGTCVFVGIPVDSTCDRTCIARLITRIQQQIPTKMKIAASPKGVRGCVGYRPDLGGTEYGAMCLARGLGLRYESEGCSAGGWAYNVIAE